MPHQGTLEPEAERRQIAGDRHMHWGRHTAEVAREDAVEQGAGTGSQAGMRQGRRGTRCILAARRRWGSTRTLGAHLAPLGDLQGECIPDVRANPDGRCRTGSDPARRVGVRRTLRVVLDLCLCTGIEESIPPVWRARLSSIILSKMVLAFTNVSFIDTRSAVKERSVSRSARIYGSKQTSLLAILVNQFHDLRPERHAGPVQFLRR